MEVFFNWLSGPGPWEELTVIILVLIVVVIIPFWAVRLKISKVSKDGIIFGDNGEKKKSNSNNIPSDSHIQQQTPLQNKETIVSQNKNNHISYNATQDHKIFTLILKEFTNKMIDEVKSYCKKNGINLKSEEEYKEYSEEKKLVYYNELKEMLQDEYVSYDVVSMTDVEEILETLRDFTFNKIENMYRKIRSISIEEHRNLEVERKEEKELFNTNLNKYIDIISNHKDAVYGLESILETHYSKYKEIILHERIYILEKQCRVVEETNKSITRRYIEEFDKIYREKRQR